MTIEDAKGKLKLLETTQGKIDFMKTLPHEILIAIGNSDQALCNEIAEHTKKKEKESQDS